MLSDDLIRYLDDKNVAKEKKYVLIRRLDLSYSDYLNLLNRYKGDAIYPTIHSLFFDNYLIKREETQRRKGEKVKKFKKTRRKKYD